MELNKTRVSKKDYYLGIARAVAQRGTCTRRIYGAVIVKNDEIIATGYNGSPRGESNCNETNDCQRELLRIPSGQNYEICRSVHAEMNAIISASRKDMIGATIYLYGIDVATGQPIQSIPCTICNRLIKNAGIKEIIGYGYYFRQD